MSDSTSSQAQTSTYTDNRVALGQGAQNANNGGVVLDTTTNYTLDGQAVSRSLDTVDGALSTVGDTITKALNFAGDSQAGALNLAGQSVSQVASFGGKVLDQVSGDEQALAAAYSDAKGQGALTQKILIVAVIGALAIAALAVQKKA